MNLFLCYIKKAGQEEYKKKSIVKRFFSYNIESCKKVFPRYEIKEMHTLSCNVSSDNYFGIGSFKNRHLRLPIN